MLKTVGAITLIACFVLAANTLYGNIMNAEKTKNLYKNCKYVELMNSKKALGPEDSMFYDEDTLISSFGNIYEIFFQMKDLKSVDKGGFVAIQGVKSGNIKAYTMEIRNYPHNVFLIPLGIYIRGDKLYAINHSFYSGDGDRVEIFQIKRINNSPSSSNSSQQQSADTADKLNGDINVSETSDLDHMFVLEFISYTHLPRRFNGITNNLVVLSENRFFITDSFPFALPLKGKNHESLIDQIITYGYYIFKITNNHIWDCSIVNEGDAVCKAFESSKSVLNNGIATDLKGNFLVADTILKTVRVFELDDDEDLVLKQTIKLDISADNINYLPESDSFLVAGTTKMTDALKLPFYIKKVENNNGSTTAIKFGSAVNEIKFNQETQQYEPHQIMDSDDIIVGASGSQINSNRQYLFVNSFVDKSLSVCQLE